MGTKSLFGRRSAAKPAHSRRGKRGAQKPAFAARSLRIERFEDRLLLSISTTPALESALYSQAALVGAPQVLSVIPNTGSIISNGAVLQSAPQQLTIQFNAGEKISPATLGAITLSRTDAAGTTTTVGLGYVGVNDAPNQNQVVVRFDSTLLSGTYTLNVATTLKDSNGNALSSAYALTFTLDLGAMVSSVVPQPVTRSISGQLQQNLKEIDVYFTDPLDPVSAQNPQLYQVIATNQTADTNDQGTPVNPVSVTYNAAKNEAVLLFAQNLNTLVQPTGTNSLRLRIGDFNEPITTTTIAAAEGEAGTSYAEAMQLSSTAFGSGPQSVAISNQIEATSYDLQWPGGPTDPGDRNLPAEPDVAIEAHFMGASGESTLGIPTYTYYFPVTYGVDANGNPVRNLITPAQEQRTREIFELYSYYFGVQFEEAAPGQTGDIGVCTGNLFPMGGTSGPGGVLGMGGGGLAVMDGAENWGTSPFGGEWQQVAMHEIMHCLGFGHSFELPADQIMGDDGAQGTSELTLPGLGDLDTALNMFRPQSTDIDMYQFTVSTPGTFSAETFAQRLSDPSLLNTELRLFTKNADGTYSVVAQNDDYFSNDSYIDLQLQPGTYYVGVSASGNDQYNPLLPDSGMGGTTQGTYELRLNFTPLTTGPATALADGDIVLSGQNITLKTGNTPFAPGQVLGQTAITDIDATHVPSVATLNGETFQITAGTSKFTFQFVDTSQSQTAQSGNMAIYFNSTTDDLDTVRADMVATINSVVTHLVGPTGTLFDGDADGTPGGTYNYWFNVTGAGDNTLFVDKSGTGAQDGSLAHPYQTISAALAAAAVDAQAGHHDIVRIEGNAGGMALIDANGNDINGNDLADQETFSVSDGTISVTFEFINATLSPLTAVTPGDVAVNFTPAVNATPAETAAALATAIVAAINNPVYHDAQGNQHIYALAVKASVAANDSRQIVLSPVVVNGVSSLPEWNPGSTPLGYSPQSTLAYEIGTGIQGNTLADGATMDVPKNTTVMIDAGAVLKLRQANIEVGSTQIGIDRSGGVLQVLGTPEDSVYFTSYQDTTIGKNDNPLGTAAHPPLPGDWGGLVFESDLDDAYDAANPGSLRTNYEQEGIFLNYVNHAVITYGGGALLVNSVRTVFDPIYMTETRVTATYNTISKSADAAMSADPNSFELSFFEGEPGVGNGDAYTADYDRAGPDLEANLLVNNSINGLLVRIATSAGEALTQLTVSACFTAQNLVYVVPENLEIAGNPGGPVIEAESSSPLIQAGPEQIGAVGGNSITDGDTFTISAGGNTKQYEFDGVSFSIEDGTQFADGDTLTITDTANPANDWVFTFGTAAAAAANPLIIPFLSSDDPGTIAASIAQTIDAYHVANPTTFTIQATALPYTSGGGDTAQAVPATVALLAGSIDGVTYQGPTATQVFTFTPVGATTGLVVVGTEGVRPTSVRIPYSAAATPEDVALDIAAAINADGTFSASAAGELVTVNTTGAVVGGLVVAEARLHANLVIDPGVVVKLIGSRIETQFGAELIAEGTAANPVIFTSLEDDRYGGGGTFDTTGDGFDTTATNTAQPGDWGGLYFAPTSVGSIDHAVIAYGGGVTSIEGGFASFNAIEIYQATVRVADSTLQYNADGTGTDTASDGERNGREDNGSATIFVRGAQPVIVNNLFSNNDVNRGGVFSNGAITGAPFSGAPVISIDCDSLNSTLVPDWGRSTGAIDAYTQYDGNMGPLVRGNVLADNGINGMLVRGGVLSTQSVWDDTDIVYVVESQISVPNQHTYGGLRLESSADASLVVKFLGANAGLTATGTLGDVTDNIGGEIQILGQSGYPVVLTSLNDATVGAGLDPSGESQDDTADGNDPKNAGGPVAPKAGDWDSVLLDQYSNDTNVAVVNQLQSPNSSTDSDGTTSNAQTLGELATSVNTGDDNLRLGYEIHGAISYDNPADADTYSFQGTAGTEVWIAAERTSYALDSVMELVDANGNVVARSDNLQQEETDPSLLTGSAIQPFQADPWTPADDYSTNPYDPGMRVVLPGPAGTVKTYYVRIYSALSIGNVDANNLPTGIGGITTANVPVGISGITTANLPNITSMAGLSGTTFQVTDGLGAKATFEFIDSAGSTTLTAGDVPIYYNSQTASVATIRGDMVQTINGYLVMGNIVSGLPVAIGGITAANVPTIADLDGMEFQITVGSTAPITFEFVDTSVRSAANGNDVPVFFDSSAGTTTLATIRANMVSAINGEHELLGAAFDCNAQAMANGEIALYGSNVVFNGAVAGESPTPFTQVLAALGNLDGATFQITDGNGAAATFEFVDTNNAGAQAAAGDVGILFNSTTATPATLLAAMASAINGAGLDCTAAVQPDNTIGLFGLGVTLDTGSTTFVGYPNVSLDLTAKTLADGTLVLQGTGVTLNMATATPTPFTAENNLENLDGTTFQITDASDNATTFEFVDVANANAAAASGDVGVYFNSQLPSTTIASIDAAIVSAINGYPVVAQIDTADVPVIKNLNGTTFHITDGLNNQATFEFIDAAGSTQLTAGDVKVSFNSALGTTTLATIRAAMATAINGSGLACTALVLPGGTVALYGQNVVMTTGTTPFAMMSASAASTNYTAQALADGTIALHGPSLTFTPGTTSFAAEQNPENLDGTTFQITDSTGKALTFEFVNTDVRTQATTGNVAVFFSASALAADIAAGNDAAVSTALATAMVTAINGYTVLGTVDAGIRGIDASHVPTISALNGETFQITDGAGIVRTFQFVDTSVAGAVAAAGDVAVNFNSTAAGINMATIRTAMVAAINGANFSCTAAAMSDGSIALYGSNLKLNLATATPTKFVAKNVLATLNATTFQITDSANTTATFELIDQSLTPETTATNGDVPIYFNSVKGTADTVRAAIVAAINSVNNPGITGVTFNCTATVLADGTIALYGASLVVNIGTASVFLLQPVAITFGCSAQARPANTIGVPDGTSVSADDTIAIYGAGAVLDTGTTSFVQVGRTVGSYQLQIRLQETEEIPGSFIQYADVSYATNGIDIVGKPNTSPLLTDTASTETAAQSATEATTGFASAQDIGNLVASNDSTISVTGHLYSTTDVNWYKFDLSYQGIEQPGITNSTFPTIFDIDYADGLARPDVVIWVFDSTGTLIYTAENSNVADDSGQAAGGTTLTSASQGSLGADDPFLGPIQLNEGQGTTYYVAVTGRGMTANALQESLLRQEPVDSVNRVVEDHTDSQNGSAIATNATTDMTLAPVAFDLGDVTLYANTTGDLFTVNPYTGAYETDVTDTAPLDVLPGALGGTTYNDISMRLDGELYTFDSNGNYDQLNTGNATAFVSSQSDGISTYDLNPQNNTVVADNANIVFQAMSNTSPDPNNQGNWPIYAIGNRVGGTGTDVPYTTNLLYEFNVNGNPVEYPNDPGNVPRLGTNVTPLASLDTSPTITVPNATAAVVGGGDVLDGQQFTITNATTGASQTYQFDCGPDVQLPAYMNGNVASPAPEAVRNGNNFTLVDSAADTKTFQFVSGPVLTISTAELANINTMTDGDTFTITNNANPAKSVTFEIDVSINGTQYNKNDVPINLSKLPNNYTAQDTLNAILAAINAAGIGVTASGFLDAPSGNGRISLLDGSLNNANPWPTVTITPNASTGAASTTAAVDANSTPPVEVQAANGTLTSGGNICINYQETESVTMLGGQMQAAVATNMPLISPSYADRGSGLAGRITFLGATNSSSFANTPFTPVLATNAVPTGVQEVPFGAADTAATLASRIGALIDALNNGAVSPVVANAGGGTVSLVNGSAVVADPLTVQGAGPGGAITGMAYLNGNMYCVSANGGLYELVDYNNANAVNNYAIRPYPFTAAEIAADPNGPATMISAGVGVGAQLNYLGMIYTTTANGLTNVPAALSGLTAGPPDVTNSAGTAIYKDMLFATDSNGKLYAIDPTYAANPAGAMNTNGFQQPAFLNGADSVQLTGATGLALTGVAGVSFSSVDYNLWHETSARATDPGHGINTSPDDSRVAQEGYPTPGGDSMYFGLENPLLPTTIAVQPGAINYSYHNAAIYQTYNIPGGAHGSLISNDFSLAGYAPQDCPTMYFTYYLDAGGPMSPNFDSARVFVSNDDSNWTELTQLSGLNNNQGWLQAKLDLSAFAGDATLQLRFDFSTSGEMQVGDTNNVATGADGGMQTGAYMTAVAATQLQDASYLSEANVASVDNGESAATKRFEFDLGGVLDVPVGAGGLIADKQTFTVTDAAHPAGVTFTLLTQGEAATTGTEIPIDPNDSPVEVASAIQQFLASYFAGDNAISVLVYENRVEILGATKVTVTAASGAQLANPNTTQLTLEGDGVGVQAGSVAIPVNFNMSAAQVATEIKTVMDATLDDKTAVAGQDNSVIIDQTTPTLLHMIGHALNKQGNGYGPLPYSNTLPGDATPPAIDPPIVNRYHSLLTGQDNAHEGVYIDDIIIGFTERGQMITGDTPNTTFSANGAGNLIPAGDYVLEIRRGPTYGTILYPPWPGNPGYRVLVLDQSFDTNDRMADAITIGATAGTATEDDTTFSITGEYTTLTFEYVLQGQTADDSDIHISYTGLETEGAMATLVANAINSVTSVAGFGVTADANGSSDRVDLFAADGASGIDDIIFGADGYFYDDPNQLWDIPGDADTPQIAGETIVNACKITNSLDWGIELQPGTRDAGSNTPYPGAISPLTVPNVQNTVGGVTIENCVVAYSGTGGIQISGDPDPAGEPTAAVPFYRIVNNTIYGQNAATLTFTKLPGAVGSSAVYCANLSGLDLSSITSIKIVDNSGSLKGNTGQFSGLELDGIKLSAVAAANAAAAAALVGLPNFDFTPAGTALVAGTQLAPVAPALFGTLNGNVNNAVATLQTFDASGAATANPAGFVATGIGGTITFTLTNPVSLAGGMFLYIAEADDDGGVTAATITAANATTGIAVENNASPTLLNNIIANEGTAISVDGTSGTTVLGANLYQNISNPAINTGTGLGSFPITLAANAPLFVNAAQGDFYLAANSLAIDSSVNSLPDRAGMVTVETSIGAPQSPIIAPSADLLGQLRTANPNGTTVGGEGENVYIDRGAIERVDTTGPLSQLGLVEPPANDPSGALAPQWLANGATSVSVPAQTTLSTFAIQLTDPQGTGVNNSTVSTSQVTITRSDGKTLADGTDYFYTYDSNNDIIYLTAGSGVWSGGYTYTITLNNNLATSANPGILDMAGNALQPNQSSGIVQYTITLVSGVNFSHAPGYPVAWHMLTNNPGLYLGTKAPLPQADYVPCLVRSPNTDDGVNFSGVSLTQGESVTLPVTITVPAGLSAVYLYGWIDYSDAGTFTSSDEVFANATAGQPLANLQVGVNHLNLTIQVPATADIGTTWARFRVSTAAGLSFDGGAPDGEVEDYAVNILPKPAEIDGTVWNDQNDNGAHDTGEPGLGGWTVTATDSNGKVDATAITSSVAGALGTYSLSGLAPGTYWIREQAPAAGWQETAPSTGYLLVTVASGQDSPGNDFENFLPPNAEIDGLVWDDLTGSGGAYTNQPVLSGWKVYVDLNNSDAWSANDPTAISQSDGTFDLQIPAAEQTSNNQYIVREVPQVNWAETAPASGFWNVTVAAGQDAAISANFGDHYLLHPMVNSLTLDASAQTPTNAKAVEFDVTFSEPVTGLVAGDFQVVPSIPGPSGAVVSTIGASGSVQTYNGKSYSSTWIVTINTGSGDGTLTFNLQDHGTIFDMSGNLLVAADETPNVFAGPTITIDKTPPTAAITLDASSHNPTNAASVTFDVTFSQAVTGVAANNGTTFTNLSLASPGLSGAAITKVSFSGAAQVVNGVSYYTTWTVTVSSGLGNSGTLQLSVNPPVTIADPAGNDLIAGTSGPVVTIDRVQPTTAISVASGQANPASAGPILFTVTFSKPVTGFAAAGVSLAKSTAAGTLKATVTPVTSSGSAGYYTTYQVSVSGMTGGGTVVAGVLAGAATDAAGNASVVSTFATVTYNPLTAVTLALASRNPTNGKSLTTGLAEPITFTATFSQAVSNFGTTAALAASQLNFTGSTAGTGGTATGLTGTVTYSGFSGGTYNYSVVVSGMAGTGNIVLAINKGTVLTASGGGNTASNSASVFYDITPPVAVMESPANGASIGATTLNNQRYIEIAYSANVGAGLSTASILNAKTAPFTLTGAAATGVKITMPPTKASGTDTYLYAFTGSFTAGTVTVNLLANTVEDNAGNWNKAASFSFTTMPGLSVNNLGVTKATSGTTTAVFTVSLSSPATKAVSVRYATANGTGATAGIAGTNYTAVSGTLSFAVGQTSKTVSVPIIGNTVNKVATFSLVLSAPTNAVITTSTGTGTINPPASVTKVTTTTTTTTTKVTSTSATTAVKAASAAPVTTTVVTPTTTTTTASAAKAASLVVVATPSATATTSTTSASKGAAVTATMSMALVLDIATASQPTAKITTTQKTAAVDAAIAQLVRVK